MATAHPFHSQTIGIEGTNAGTISNEDGTFELLVPEVNLGDSITFSALGFHREKMAVGSLQSPETVSIFLKENVKILEEVIVFASKEKRHVLHSLGNRTFKSGVLEEDTTYAGRALAILIEPTPKSSLRFPLLIHSAYLRIFRNNLDTCRFRVRLNRVHPETGAPGEDFLLSNIIAISSIKNGWLEFNLPGGTMANEPFFVTFEQLLDRADRAVIAQGYRDYIKAHPDRLIADTVVFNGTKEVAYQLRGGIDLPGTMIAVDNRKSDEHICFERRSSLAPWTRRRGVVAAYVTVEGVN